MKLFIFSILSFLLMHTTFSQGRLLSVVSDSIELQQFDDGQQLKVSYLLNGKAISLKDKEALFAKETYVQQEFNIKTIGKEVIGEINLLLPESKTATKQEARPLATSVKTLDLLKDLKGIPFPPFNWTDINGNKLSADGLRGKTVVLNFWHTSCIPCIAEMPLLNELVKQYKEKNVVFISSTPNSPEELKGFLTKVPFQYTHVPATEPRSIFDPFPGWPIHIVMDGEGTIKFHAIGKQKDIEQKLMKAIDESLAANK